MSIFYPTTKIQLRDIQGIAAGATALINCPKGPRYRMILLALGDANLGSGVAPTVAGTAGEIKVILGSKVIRRATGTQIDAINTLNGKTYQSYTVGTGATGLVYLPIYFNEPWRKRPDVGDGLSLQTGWLDTNGVFQISIALAGTTPVLGAMAITDAYWNGKGPNNIMKWYADDANTAAAELDLANIFQGAPAGDAVESISLFNTSDGKSVTKARLTFGNITIVDDVTSDQNTSLLQDYDMDPADAAAIAGAYHIVFDHDDQLQSLYPISSIGSSELIATLSAASNGTLRRITQRLGDPTA